MASPHRGSRVLHRPGHRGTGEGRTGAPRVLWCPKSEAAVHSVFALHDGHFMFERIIRCELENPQFVYLSACQGPYNCHGRGRGESRRGDASHAAMQCSTTGMVWAATDAAVPKITVCKSDHCHGGWSETMLTSQSATQSALIAIPLHLNLQCPLAQHNSFAHGRPSTT